MLARSHLAAIDHNHHLHRSQARDAKGQLVFSRRWRKRAKRWKVVIVKEKKNYRYLPIMCAGVLKNASKEFMKNVKPVTSEQNPLQQSMPKNVRTCQRAYFKVLTLKLLYKAMFKKSC